MSGDRVGTLFTTWYGILFPYLHCGLPVYLGTNVRRVPGNTPKEEEELPCQNNPTVPTCRKPEKLRNPCQGLHLRLKSAACNPSSLRPFVSVLIVRLDGTADAQLPDLLQHLLHAAVEVALGVLIPSIGVQVLLYLGHSAVGLGAEA
jgi:hypothetical protein